MRSEIFLYLHGRRDLEWESTVRIRLYLKKLNARLSSKETIQKVTMVKTQDICTYQRNVVALNVNGSYRLLQARRMRPLILQ